MRIPTGGEDAASTISTHGTQRWRAVDPLLPALAAPPPGCGAELLVPGPGGMPAAIGICEHWAGDPHSLDMTWGAARRFRLTIRSADPDVANTTDQLLAQWRDHLACAPGADGEDTAAVVDWPSRDVAGVAMLRRHGLTPHGVIAARTRGGRSAQPATGMARRADGAAAAAIPGVRIRRAGTADADTVTRLGLEVVRFDAHFGGVRERAETAGAMRRMAGELLMGPAAWIWLAEREGSPIGMLFAERPESAGWIAPMVGRAPVAYLMLMFVQASERNRGVGAALVARLHREVDAVGVAVTLLHYEQVNPLSVPFWSQRGYRPLWTSWEARPACAVS